MYIFHCDGLILYTFIHANEKYILLIFIFVTKMYKIEFLLYYETKSYSRQREL